jgi:hypothetical protein
MRHHGNLLNRIIACQFGIGLDNFLSGGFFRWESPNQATSVIAGSFERARGPRNSFTKFKFNQAWLA